MDDDYEEGRIIGSPKKRKIEDENIVVGDETGDRISFHSTRLTASPAEQHSETSNSASHTSVFAIPSAPAVQQPSRRKGMEISNAKQTTTLAPSRRPSNVSWTSTFHPLYSLYSVTARVYCSPFLLFWARPPVILPTGLRYAYGPSKHDHYVLEQQRPRGGFGSPLPPLPSSSLAGPRTGEALGQIWRIG
jgi:hypothetical protein